MARRAPKAKNLEKANKKRVYSSAGRTVALRGAGPLWRPIELTMSNNDKQTRTRRPLLATKGANIVRYALMNLFIIAGIATMATGGWWMWAGLAMTLTLINLVDELMGDAGNAEAMPPVWYMDLMLRLTLPLLVVMTLVCLNTVGSGHPGIDAAVRWFGFDPEAARNATDLYTRVGGIISMGMFYGLGGIVVAHNLTHRPSDTFDYVLGRWLLAFSWDTGFAIEHVYGHHRNVGTDKDPATAKRGEYIFFFVVRSAIGQFLAARDYEKARLERRGIPNRIWNNVFWRGQLMTLCVIALFVYLTGPVGIIYSAMAAAMGKLYLEMVNYVEHYGLVRIPGKPVEDRHSWDSHKRLTTGLTYNLPLHSNHHRFATRPFWELQQAHGRAPVWPLGYISIIVVSFFPPLWHKVSEPLLADWDKRLASEEERELLRSTGELRG
ncbi:MAG TPA: alkane 1-monooxygenase [Devosia sp.]|nr:alkane 1-monooxygenase [Devosia sp.]